MPDLDAAAAALVEARQQNRRLAGLPSEPATQADAFAIQDRVTARLGARIAGWKAGIAPGADPTCAPMFESGFLASPARVPQAGRTLFGVEAEIAFRFAHPLPPREKPYERADVIAAIGSAHPVIELVESRFEDGAKISPLAKLADNVSHGGFVHGPALVDWQRLDITRVPVVLTIDGVEAGRAIGGNPSGDPLLPVIWLANHLAARTGGITAGQFVTTGATTGLVRARRDAVVRVAFEGLGTAECRFVD